MSPDESLTSPTAPELPPEAPPLADITAPVLHGRARNGKVARLPKAIRDRLNNMLLDGVTAAQILQELI
jgi:hypothetical protein